MTIFLIDHEVTGQILEKYLKFLIEKLKLDPIKIGFSMLFELLSIFMQQISKFTF